jgi:glycosyltransferase involved in cell wall biosynthesis
MTTIYCLRQTWGHMSDVSGFDPLAQHLDSIASVKMYSMYPKIDAMPSITSRLYNRLNKVLKRNQQSSYKDLFHNPYFDQRHYNNCCIAVKEVEQYKNKNILLMAGEDQISSVWFSASSSVRMRMAITLHQPSSWMRLNWPDMSIFKEFGMIICLSESQQKFMQNIGVTRSLCVRHGVRHDYFVPDLSKKSLDTPRLLFVGQWLRDFVTLEATMLSVWSKRPDVHLDCVIPRFSRSNDALFRLARDSRVSWYSDIAPDCLRFLYQRATLLFLPLLDAVANNAVVEALSCGLPIITSNVGGISDYIPDGTGCLCTPSDSESHAHAILDWIDDDVQCSLAGKIGREFAVKELDWGHIALKLVSALQLKN